MKIIFTFFTAILFAGAMNAQCYHVAPVAYNHDALIAPATATMLDDHYTGLIPIGFPFCFYGASYDSLSIGDNAVLCFNTSCANNYCIWPISGAIPFTNDPMNAILFCWQDLYGIGGGSVKYQTIGSSPNRKFIVEFDSVPMYSCTGMFFSGQVKLFETSNVVEMDIAQKQLCSAWNGGYAIEGMQNSLGTSAVSVSGRNYPAQWTASNDGWTFTPTCDVCSGVGIAEPQNQELSLFVSDHNQITVLPNNSSYKMISVYDMLGQEVKFTQTGNTISFAENVSGIYIINLEVNGTRMVKKVMMN